MGSVTRREWDSIYANAVDKARARLVKQTSGLTIAQARSAGFDSISECRKTIIADSIRRISKEVSRFKELMELPDESIRIGSVNERVDLEGDLAYRNAVRFNLTGWVEGIRSRTITEKEYRRLAEMNERPTPRAIVVNPGSDTVTDLARVRSGIYAPYTQIG